MKTLIALTLSLLALAGAVAGYGSLDIGEVTAAVSGAGSADAAQLLMCGSALIVLSVTVRRSAF